jgi:hypothetical protein
MHPHEKISGKSIQLPAIVIPLTWRRIFDVFTNSGMPILHLLKEKTLIFRSGEIRSVELNEAGKFIYVEFLQGGRCGSLVFREGDRAFELLLPLVTSAWQPPVNRAKNILRRIFSHFIYSSTAIFLVIALILVSALSSLRQPTASFFLAPNCPKPCGEALSTISRALIAAVGFLAAGYFSVFFVYIFGRKHLKEWNAFRAMQVESSLFFAIFTYIAVALGFAFFSSTAVASSIIALWNWVLGNPISP